MLLQMGCELVQSVDKVTGLFRQNGSQFPLGFVEFPGQYAFDQGRLAGKVGIERFLAHPDFGGEIVHGNIFETVSHEMVASGGEDAVSDWIGRTERGGGDWLGFHTL